MTRTYYILILICVVFTGCSETYNPDFEENRKIVLECTLAPGEDPTARIHLTNSILDTTEAFYYPAGDDADIMITNFDTPDTSRVTWNGAASVFTSQSFPIKEGNTYKIEISVPEKDVEPITAITTVPVAETIESVVIASPIGFQPYGDNFFLDLEVQVEIPEPSDPLTYYQLIPEIKNGEVASTGVIQYDALTRKEVKVLSDENAIKQFIHKSGIFIDNSRIDDNTIDLLLSFKVPAQYYSFVDSVSFTLNTVNREYMVYHEKTDRELKISSLPLDEPQISTTNIQNGYGLFGAFSSSKVVVSIE